MQCCEGTSYACILHLSDLLRCLAPSPYPFTLLIILVYNASPTHQMSMLHLPQNRMIRFFNVAHEIIAYTSSKDPSSADLPSTDRGPESCCPCAPCSSRCFESSYVDLVSWTMSSRSELRAVPGIRPLGVRNWTTHCHRIRDVGSAGYSSLYTPLPHVSRIEFFVLKIHH